MKLGFITKPNAKGQIVIPKEIRDALGIDSSVTLNLVVRGKGCYVYPVEEVIAKVETESSYIKILSKTKGAWGPEKGVSKKRQRWEKELLASQRRKKAW